MDIDEIIEKRLEALGQCINGGMEFLLEAYSERNFIYHLLYIKQNDKKVRDLTNS